MEFQKLGGVVVAVVIIVLLLHAMYEANVTGHPSHTSHSPKTLPVSHTSADTHSAHQERHVQDRDAYMASLQSFPPTLEEEVVTTMAPPHEKPVGPPTFQPSECETHDALQVLD